MQRIINPLFYIFVLTLLIVSCKSTSKINHKKYLDHLRNMDESIDYEYIEELKKSSSRVNMDSIRANTSDFYDIEIVSKPNKKVFNLDEQKLFSMQITNYGTKELYLPEWFKDNKDLDNIEIAFEIYKKEKQKFVKYIQKRMKTDILRQPAINSAKRVIFETNKGKHIVYENIWFDINQKIVDEGSYKAKVYIDLSSFGYFKTLETEVFFEVKD